ncbi:uncharacterized protein [Solanum tuberosum]|uniref:uncharacterized protein n=1 Tax=Solanum tuberosum TaxID=4113 RepID=UPI00073A26FE|nr:PREDICTED: uncharacterized protein LOC102588207 [Solanum tuberosum]
MAGTSEKGGSLHTGGAISQVTRKERMEKELGRPVAVSEMFKVTHVKKSTNPTEEERWIEPRAQETYDRYIRISQEYRSTLPLESQDRPFTQEENENLWKQSAGELIRGSVYGYPEKAYQKKKSWYCGSSSSSFDGGDRETISAMESKIAYLNAELAVVAEREKKREKEIAAAKEVENKRYAALQAQLTFLFESRSILPPCPANSDGSDQEGDENDKSDKESEGDENGKSDKESEGDEKWATKNCSNLLPVGIQIPRKRVHVIVNGVDEIFFCEDSRLGHDFGSKIGLPQNATIVLGVAGRLVKDKGHPLLHEAFSQLKEKYPNVYLIVAGSGPWLQRYKDLGPQVIVLGSMNPSELKAFYNSIDIFVNPTLRPQGLDLTFMEAMMSGKPIMASRFPSIKGTIVVNDEYGFMFTPNVESLVEALERVVEEGRGKLARRGKACREYASSMFTAKKMALAYERLFLCIKNETFCTYH